ncbi:sigma factor-like helix-turn-helix DNA-binding protein [Novosphingobium fluoreni]|uniref:RNA polymerase sigma-70 factor (ECF subfamily) n=1 Tax=Novosphingobium fluoreni TaxID=1391222 RepID=A0A7W6BXZ2_9SPHN|nr:sigma factor-like helix-turn-helix DNA-binding protein [Novosphingobium fluoreni]MBB3938902.1 RNA polymerase sigma-70 factor (ECF subfamily) [Novosphingobium fluoreni]
MSEQRPSRAFVRKARRSLRRMTNLQREVFLAMRFEEGVTYAQLAKRYGLTESEVQHAFASALFIFAKSIRKPEPWWWRLWPW